MEASQMLQSSESSSIATFYEAAVTTLDTPMDPDTAALIAQLAFDDLNEIMSRQKGKAREDVPLSDAEYAYKLQSENFKDWLMVFDDARYARSLDNALEKDSAYLEEEMILEEAAVEDRLSAEFASRGEALPRPSVAQARVRDPDFVMQPESLDDVVPTVTEQNRNVIAHDADKDIKDDSAPTLDRLGDDYTITTFFVDDSKLTPGPNIKSCGVDCTICGEHLAFEAVLHTECSHFYCAECISSLVENFMRDEALFPLRCCKKPIGISLVDGFITSALRALFLEKHAEFSVPSINRVYCAQPNCSAFLGSSESSVSDIKCFACNDSTCPGCKQAQHVGEDCAANAATTEFLELARSQGWQRCPGCHAIVELNIGCHHMTCRCRTQFCYLCAALWKNCECPRWEEERLLATAQHRVENELGDGVIQPEVRAQQVERRVRTLRFEQDCTYHVWRHRNGRGTCEGCSNYYNRFLKICRNCSLLACVSCTRNRY